MFSIIKELQKQGISAIPWRFSIKKDGEHKGYASKYPALKKEDNWAQYRDRLPTEQEINDWDHRGLLKGPGPGYGVNAITGQISNILTVDCDDAAAIEWVEKHLSSEDSVLRQRTGNGGMHYIFLYDPGLKTQDRAIPGVNLDILSDKKQMILAPSEFQNGTKIKNDKLGTGKYELLDGMELKDRGKIPEKLKAALLAGIKAKAKAKPKKSAEGDERKPLYEGKRNSELFKIACDFVRRGLTQNEMSALLADKNNRLCNPPLNDDELKIIAESAVSLNTSPDEAVSRINKDHYYGNSAGKPVVYVESGERKNGKFKLTEVAYKTFVINQKPYYVMQGKKKVYDADIWIESTDRNVLKKIIFDPDEPPFISRDKDGEFIYNRYHGFAYEPKNVGSWELFRNHIRDIICGGNREHFYWVLAWMANIVQRKIRKPGKVIVLVGENGTGKSTFARLFGNLFGEHYTAISDKKRVVGNFNGSLQGKLLVNIDDTLFRNDHTGQDILKFLVTEETFIVNEKWKAEENIKNFMHFIISSNSTDPIPLQAHERRYVVFHMDDKKMCDFEYFERMKAELENGGYEAMLYELLNYEIEEYHLRSCAPKTEIMAENQLENLSPLAQWFHGALENGHVDIFDKGFPSGQRRIFDDDIPKDDLFVCFQQWCEYHKHRYNLIKTKTKFSTSLQQLCPSIKYKDIRVGGMGGKCGYRIPDIDICRKEFEASQGITIQWDD